MLRYEIFFMSDLRYLSKSSSTLKVLSQLSEKKDISPFHSPILTASKGIIFGDVQSVMVIFKGNGIDE